MAVLAWPSTRVILVPMGIADTVSQCQVLRLQLPLGIEPKRIIDALEAGGLTVVPGENGVWFVEEAQPATERQMRIAEEVMRRDRNLLRNLAKR